VAIKLGKITQEEEWEEILRRKRDRKRLYLTVEEEEAYEGLRKKYGIKKD